MKFRSRRDNEVIRIASTSGHICLVGSEFVEVPDHMESDAYAAGCVSEALYNSIKADMEKDAAAKAALVGGALTEDQKHEAIKVAIGAMLDSKDESSFTKEGLPNMKALVKQTGFTVSKEEMEKAWSEIAAQAGSSEG